jgi:tRNA(Ile)-lysidine synthase
VSSRRPARPDAATDILTAPSRFNPAWLRQRLRSLLGPLRDRQLCLAYSGGLDSCALLCALAALRTHERFVLRALHVNHQLHPQASTWARQAQARARRLRVPCEVLKVTVNTGSGESLEAAARAARYQALISRLHSGELLLTAHHQEDQLETVLLALMRGSGVRGLSAMAAVSEFRHARVVRPLLPVARAQLERYVRRRAFSWSEDPSNTDERFDRNYLRRVVVPLLRARWPAAAATVSRSAAHLAETRKLLEQLGQQHLSSARDGPALRVSALRRLSAAERGNALRVWIAQRGLPAPDQARMLEVCGPMLAARPDATPCVRWQGVELRRHGDRLFACTPSAPQETPEVARWNWRRQPCLSLGPAGSLELVRDRHGDVRLSALPRLLSVRYRNGGERLKGTHGHHALKDLLQKKGLVPWQRLNVPLVMHGETIVAVADLWLAPQYGGGDAPGASRARLRWRRSV